MYVSYEFIFHHYYFHHHRHRRNHRKGHKMASVSKTYLCPSAGQSYILLQWWFTVLASLHITGLCWVVLMHKVYLNT
jgi:hypothetical protein